MSTRGMSPSARAAAHAAKIQAREARKARTPGPGSYDPGLMNKSGSRPSSAFKSNSRRGELTDSSQGDPGSYDPYAAIEIAQTSRGTFSRSAKSGAGAFGTKSAREMATGLVGTSENPGPGSYDSKSSTGLFDKMPSSAFRSSSQQRHKAMHSDTPGVGSYTPKRNAIEPNVRNVGHGMRGRDERFKFDKPTTDDNVGPGMYDAATGDDLASRSTADANKGNSAVFASDTVRGLPY